MVGIYHLFTNEYKNKNVHKNCYPRISPEIKKQVDVEDDIKSYFATIDLQNFSNFANDIARSANRITEARDSQMIIFLEIITRRFATQLRIYPSIF